MVAQLRKNGEYFLTILFLLCLVILTACSAQKITTTPTHIPTTAIPTRTQIPPTVIPTRTQVPPTATPINTPVQPTAIRANTQVPLSVSPGPRPFPELSEWDLLIISDSTNFGVGQYYANLIEADMKVKVNLHDCWIGQLSIGRVLQALESGEVWRSTLYDRSCSKPITDLVKEAEVMVLFGNDWDSLPPERSFNASDDYSSCMGHIDQKKQLPNLETYKERLLKSCAPETFSIYKTHFGAVLDEIDKIREGRPLILRMTDFYIMYHDYWVENGVDDVCTTCIGSFSEAIHQVAEEHGVPVVSTMIALNGKDYMSDPVDAGYIGPDEIHLSVAGRKFVATLLQQTGYGYAGK